MLTIVIYRQERRNQGNEGMPAHLVLLVNENGDVLLRKERFN